MKPSFSEDNCSDPSHSNLPSQGNGITQEGQISAAPMATGHCPHQPEPWVHQLPFVDDGAWAGKAVIFHWRS